MKKYPLFELASVLLKRLAKPLAEKVANVAQNSPYLANVVCIPLGQAFHRLKVRIRLKNLGIEKNKIPYLPKENASELGAQVLLEGSLVLLALLIVIYEHYKPKKMSKCQVERQYLRKRLEHLNDVVVDQNALINVNIHSLKSLANENVGDSWCKDECKRYDCHRGIRRRRSATGPARGCFAKGERTKTRAR